LQTLRDELSYNFLSEHSAIDWLAKSGEFEIFYQLLSSSKRKRLRVKCFIKEKEVLKSLNAKENEDFA
jgi:NADH-quinone oxidoreductase subunit C